MKRNNVTKLEDSDLMPIGKYKNKKTMDELSPFYLLTLHKKMLDWEILNASDTHRVKEYIEDNMDAIDAEAAKLTYD